MAFDASQFGATLATPTSGSTPLANPSGFNATQFGATLVANSQTPSQVAQPQQSSSLGISDVLGINKGGLNPSQVLGLGQQYLGSVGNAIKSGAGQVAEGYNTAKNASSNPNLLAGAGQLLSGGTQMAAGALGTLFSPFAPIGSAINKTIVQPAANLLSNTSLIKGAAGNTTVNAGGTQTYTPNMSADTTLNNINNANTVVGGVAGAMDLAPKVQGLYRNVKTALTTPTPPDDATVQAQTASDLQKINETISPKQTAGQAKLAQSQGRLYPGQDATLFKGETPNQIATPDSQYNATRTIYREIPKAAEMDAPTLYNAIGDKVTEIANNLRPQMEEVPIQEPTVAKITSDWDALKAKQLEEANASDEPNIVKWQSQFERFLTTSKSENMGDLWDTRKAYDDSIPPRVKNATSMSSDALQVQRQAWLQNRAILNNAINDTSSGLGGTSKQAFSDMSDMYNAQKNLQTTATTSSAKLLPSKLSQAYNSTAGKVLRTTVKAGAVAGGAKLLGL